MKRVLIAILLLVMLLYGKRHPGHTATEFEPNTEKNAGQ